MSSLKSHPPATTSDFGGALRWGLIWLLTFPQLASAAYSCNLTVERVNLLTLTSAIAAVTRTLTLNCSREPSDPSSMTYRIGADNGLHAQATARRVRRGTQNNFLAYRLNRGNGAGQAAPCNTSGTIWRASGGGLMTGTMNFGSGFNASQTWSYCTVSNASGTLPAGEYTDQVLVTLRYPNTAAGQLLTVPLDLQLAVQTSCLIDKPIGNLTVNHTSLQSTATTASTSVLLVCNSGLPWSVGLQGPSAPTAPPANPLTNQSLLGLTYSLQVTPASGTGLGNINNGQQPVTIQLTVPGGQAGTCSMGSCSASATHTLVITY